MVVSRCSTYERTKGYGTSEWKKELPFTIESLCPVVQRFNNQDLTRMEREGRDAMAMAMAMAGRTNVMWFNTRTLFNTATQEMTATSIIMAMPFC